MNPSASDTEGDTNYVESFSVRIVQGVERLSPKQDATALHFPLDPDVTQPLSLSDIQVIRVVGTGAMGKVYQVKLRPTSSIQAMKVIRKNKTSLQSAIREQHAMLRASGHTFFAPLHASFHDSDNFYIVTKYFPRGDLASEIARCRKILPKRARIYCAELIVALQTLHSLDIVHRDLKPSNILIDERGHLVLADFGIAKMFGGDSFEPPDSDIHELSAASVCPRVTRRGCGTPAYMAPEVHIGHPYGFGTDYWSMGIILYEMLTGRPPFWKRKDDTVRLSEKIASEPLPFSEDGGVDKTTQFFLNWVLAKKPRKRPKIAQMLNHKYFFGINWDQIRSRELEVPFIPPKRTQKLRISSTAVNFIGGTPYTAEEDPFPQFTYASPNVRMSSEGISKRRPAPSFKDGSLLIEFLVNLRDRANENRKRFSLLSVPHSSAKLVAHEKWPTIRIRKTASKL